MKKIVFSLIFLVCFSSIWAVWEGNGGIGSHSEFPTSGLFVRSDMFPKHTLLEITNLEKNKTARAVVVGPSGVPGLLLSLSPDLGSKLSVPAGKVVRVRVLTPSPVQEIGDDGLNLPMSDIESKDQDDNPSMVVAANTEVAPAPIIEKKPVTEQKSETEEVPLEKTSQEDSPIIEEPQEEIPPVEETIVETPEVEKPTIENPVVEDKPGEDPIVEEPTVQEVPPIEPIADKPEEIVMYDTVEQGEKPEPIQKTEVVAEPKPEPIKEPEIIEEPEPQTEPEVVAVAPIKTYMEPTDMRPPQEVEGIKKPEQKIKPEKAVVEIDSPVKKEDKKQEKIQSVNIINPPKQQEEKQSDPEPIVDTVETPTEPENEIVEDQPSVMVVDKIKEKPEEPKTIETKPVEEIYEIEETQPEIPIVKPKKEKITEPIEVESEEPIAEPVEVKPEPEEPIAEPVETIPAPETPIVEPIETVEEPEEIYAVEEETPIFNSKLEQGKLYVQIVVYTEAEQAEQIVKNYGSQYPMVIEEKQYKKDKKYIVFIGPLQPEETGATIERFEQLGFKGAFAKRIQ